MPVPKAYTVNGVDEYMRRTLVTTAPGTIKFTYSLWIKPAAWLGASNFLDLWIVHNAGYTTLIVSNLSGAGNEFYLVQAGAQTIEETATPITPDIPLNAWTHLLVSFDSSQAAAVDRLKFYVNGGFVADTAVDQPTLNQPHNLFTNGFLHDLFADPGDSEFDSTKGAFIDVIDGLALDPTSFAFNNGGTWTRKKYSGSYGTYGFCLDGSDGFNDISGNAQHFTGINMDATNLSAADMPPFTN